jgi:hypothetical protein
MAKTPTKPSFDQALTILRSHSFDVAPFAGVANGMLVSKHGVAAVLVPDRGQGNGKDAPAAFAIHPGVLVRGEVARLLDRGYQKFIKTSKYELPATATQLQAIHTFSEELSDLYEYDRLQGREVEQPAPASPWELADGH